MSDNSFSWSAPSELVIGASFSSSSTYRLIRRLGAGGMGEVWLAERRSAAGHGQQVAVKFLSRAYSIGSFADEALRVSRLSHDNIVPFVDSGRDASGRYFMALAYVHGVDLDGLRSMIGLTHEAAYGGKATVRIPSLIVGFVLFMVLRALHYAHGFNFGDGVRGLVHRDVSPGNILIDETRGFVKLSDFGVAVPTTGEHSAHQVAGKVPYMAPEVLRGTSAEPSSDLYALGVVAYELLTGFNPNVRPSHLKSVIAAITDAMMSFDRPLRPCHEVVAGVDPDLSGIVARMLATDPTERYSSADEVIGDLTPYLYELGVGPSTVSLISYIDMLRGRDVARSDRVKRSLSFLQGSDGRFLVKPSWVLRPEVVAQVEKGNNPARV